MKNIMMQLAGVTTEKDFYKKFPTQESFMAKHGAAFKKALKGKKAQNGLTEEGSTLSKYGIKSMINPDLFQSSGVDGSFMMGASEGISGAMPYIQGGSDIIKGISQIKGQKKALKESKQNVQLTGLQAKASGIEEEPLERDYLTPEEQIMPIESFTNPKGTGFEILAKRGAKIPKAEGGLKTFKTNLENSGFGKTMSVPGVDQLFDTFGNLVTNKGRGEDAGSNIGGGIGSIAGTALFGPVGGMVGKQLGKFIGGAIDTTDDKIAKNEEIAQGNMNTMIGNNMAKGIRSSNAAFMKSGGNIKSALGGDLQILDGSVTEISNNPFSDSPLYETNGNYHSEGGNNIIYSGKPVNIEKGETLHEDRNGLNVMGDLVNPLTKRMFKTDFKKLGKKEAKEKTKLDESIEKIGEMSIDTPLDKITFASLLMKAKGSTEKLRRLNETKQEYTTTQTAINETAAEQNLDAKALSQGIIKKAKGTNKTTAQRGKTVESSPQGDLTPQEYIHRVTHNILQEEYPYISKERIPYGAPLSEVEIISELPTRPPMRGYNPPKAEVPQLEEYIRKNVIDDNPIPLMGALQSIYPEYIQSMNDERKYNERMKEWERNSSEFRSVVLPQQDAPQVRPIEEEFNFMDEVGRTFADVQAPYAKSQLPNAKSQFPTFVDGPPNYDYESGKTPPDYSDEIVMGINSVLPYLRPTDANERLDPAQLLGEMFALSNNQVEPVKAQQFTPRLAQPQSVSFRDRLNEITASTRAAQRNMGYNPAAQANLAAMDYKAKSGVLGEQFRANQEMWEKVFAENRGALDNAAMKNLEILDQQFVRQETAKSATKATTQAALSSIADKYLKNRMENRTLQVYENLYNYRYDPLFRALNMNPLATFNYEGSFGNQPIEPGKEDVYVDRNGQSYRTDTRKTPKERTAKNGSFIKAARNL